MECPICLTHLSGTLATVGCCNKTLHIECLIKCMEMKLTCPFCRAEHESLHTIREHERIIMVPVPTKTNLLRDTFVCTVCLSIIGISVGWYF